MRKPPKQCTPEWSPSRIRDELKPLMYLWSLTPSGTRCQALQPPRRVGDLPQDVLDFGKRVHAAIARLINIPPNKQGRVIHYQEVQKFRQSWFMLTRGARTTSVNIDINSLLQGIYNFYGSQIEKGVKFLGKEVKFRIAMPPDNDGYAPVVNGRVDLINRDGKDLIVCDHKLPFEHLTISEAAWDPQATVYLWAVALWSFQDDQAAEYFGLPCSEKRDWNSYLETTLPLITAEFSNIAQSEIGERQWILQPVRTNRTIDDLLFLRQFMKTADLTKFYAQFTSHRITEGGKPVAPPLLRLGFPRAPTITPFPLAKKRTKRQYRFQINDANQLDFSKLVKPKPK